MSLFLSDLSPRKPNKYRAKRKVLDGISFHSQREAERYAVLKLMERAGEISELELQPQFVFFVGDKPIFKYIADFKYFDRSGKEMIEDSKGMRTPLYKLKKRLVEAQLGITITEV